MYFGTFGYTELSELLSLIELYVGLYKRAYVHAFQASFFQVFIF